MDNKKKLKAHQAVAMAIKNGSLKRAKSCEECGVDLVPYTNKSNLNAHHSDYSKLLEVKWLCGKCHVKVHRKEGTYAYSKEFFRRAGKLGAEATHKKRYEMLASLSKFVASKQDLNWIQAKWKTAQIAKLLEAYKK